MDQPDRQKDAEKTKTESPDDSVFQGFFLFLFRKMFNQNGQDKGVVGRKEPFEQDEGTDCRKILPKHKLALAPLCVLAK